MPLIDPIVPLHRLPANDQRLGEGGRRLHRPEEEPPEFSVVTIALNPGRHLESTMASVLQWNSPRMEYIVIDGGSTDATRALLARHDQQISYWVSEPDRGISDAFNKGIALCRGKVVGLINAGDWYPPQTMDEVLAFFSGHPAIGVLCGRLQFWREGKRAYLCDSVPDLLERDMTVTHPACFLRRELYLEHGGFARDFRLAMDYELLLRLKCAGVAFARTDEVLANMIHEGLAEQNWRAALEETHRARQAYLADKWTADRNYLLYLVARRRLRFLLERLGFDGVVRFYREHIAAVRKEKT